MIAIILALLVAILDTGIAPHPHFAHTTVSGDLGDNCGHGTAMAGIVVDNAPQVQLLSIDVDNNNCFSSHITLAAAIREAADAGAQVVLVAWDVLPDRSPMVEAAAYAEERGTIVVFSRLLGTSAAVAPHLDGGYAVISGTSVAAAQLVGRSAWALLEQAVYLPLVED